MSLADWLAKFRDLHERAAADKLSAPEWVAYREGREELARALLAAQRLSLKPGETPRQALRVARALQVNLEWSKGQVRALTMDISVGGFAALLAKAPATTDEVKFTLRLPGGSDSLGRGAGRRHPGSAGQRARGAGLQGPRRSRPRSPGAGGLRHGAAAARALRREGPGARSPGPPRRPLARRDYVFFSSFLGALKSMSTSSWTVHIIFEPPGCSFSSRKKMGPVRMSMAGVK